MREAREADTSEETTITAQREMPSWTRVRAREGTKVVSFQIQLEGKTNRISFS